jgi:hypothetical protein
MGEARKKETALPGAAQGYRHNNSNYSTRWARVTKRNPCPICRHGDWCRISPEGVIAGCMRQEAGAFKTAPTNAGPMYLHRLTGLASGSSLAIPEGPALLPSFPLATADHRHSVNSRFLEALSLSESHQKQLREDRRFSDETIVRNFYRSVPNIAELGAIFRELSKDVDFAGVPGFFKIGEEPRCEARSGEMLVPARDHRGRIVAILRRTGRTPKYLWMSNRNHGPSCGTPLHWSSPRFADLYPERAIVITEGVLKADCIADAMQCCVIGLPGVSLQEHVDHPVLEFLKGRDVTVAFDADFRSNPQVFDALKRLSRTLSRAEVEHSIAVWNESLGKGLDDVIRRGDA